MLALLPLILGIAPEIAKWIGGGQAAVVTHAVTDAVRTITGTDNPEQAAQIVSGDPAKASELRVQLAKIAADAEAAQREAELETLKATLAAAATEQQNRLEAFRTSIADIASARTQTTDLAKVHSALAWAPAIISVLLLISFAVILYLVLIVGVKESSLALGNVLLGSLTAMVTQVANYWLGSSTGSVRKDVALQDAQEKIFQSVPSDSLPHPSAIVPAATVTAEDEPRRP